MDALGSPREFLNALPHCAELGITLDSEGEGWAVLSMPYDPRLIGDPATGVIAGGAVSVLMDTASGCAVMSHPEAHGVTATLDLRIDYMRAATPGQRLRARAECHHVTRTVAFVRATAFDDGDKPVAMSNGTFTVLREGNAMTPEPVQVVKQRRDAALAALVAGVPYIGFLGINFDRRGDELTAILPYRPMLIGNPLLPALHGGVTAAFLEVASIIELAWQIQWKGVEAGGTPLPALPKTIGITVDYLRSGLPRDAYARARVNRSGRRYASVHVEAWQDNRSRLFAQATGHFLMPEER